MESSTRRAGCDQFVLRQRVQRALRLIKSGTLPVVTIEAIAGDRVGRTVQDAWVSTDVVQCGYCQSGQIMTAAALLKSIPKPTDAQIERGMGGNICRCGTYVRIRQAIKQAAQRLG
jgi:isoquinoline 1-oxidoreductase alpha subunit